MDVTLTDNAAKRFKLICEAEDKPYIRLAVDGGGCSGFQYHWDLAEEPNSDDQLFERDGARLLIDNTSIELLRGSEIDYIEEIVGSMFKVNNPNADSGCGCGASFSTK